MRVRKAVFTSGAIVIAMFSAMIVYMCMYAATHEADLFNNDYNGREEILLDKNIRGKIYSSDKQVMAETVLNEDGSMTRVYPFGSLFSHIVGYESHGGSGIEQQYNYALVHSDISLSEMAEFDAAGEKYPGNDVYTTLNVGLQKAAYDALGNYHGAIIVSEVKTGKILAMVSKPDFDPGTIDQTWDSIVADGVSGVLVNRVTQGLYPPGSTFKIFDAVEFMQEDMAQADAYNFNCQGYVTIDGEMINCYHWSVHGDVDLKESFADSCNSSFATIGSMLNRQAFAKTLSTMMFNEKLPYEFPSEVSTYKLDSETTTKDLMQLSIGQGETLMTPLHLNMITAALANGGVVHKPYLVNAVETCSGKILSSNQPESFRTVVSSDIASRMRVMMRAVVESGTGTRLRNRPYNAAGKTGSAEFLDNESDSHAWFTGFAPYEDPEIAITVIIEGAGSGGSYAVPVARRVMDTYFGYEGDDDDVDASYWTTYSTTANLTGTQQTTQTDTAQTGTDSTAAGQETGGVLAPPDAGAMTSPGQQTPAPLQEDIPANTVQLNIDTNGDGIPDALDSDGDGKPDMYDMNGDGMPEMSAAEYDAIYHPQPAAPAAPQDAAGTAAPEQASEPAPEQAPAIPGFTGWESVPSEDMNANVQAQQDAELAAIEAGLGN